MPLDSEKFPTAGWNTPRGKWDKYSKARELRRKHRREVNDPSWRDKLKAVGGHPRREKRGQGKPR